MLQIEETKISQREYDINGWMEIQGNPLSKAGVFPYLGRQIDRDGSMGLDPDKIYNVLRPEEELSNTATLESFRLLPFTDEHEMLGKDFTPAEVKGVAGVIGETVYFEYPYLKANIKIFSERLKRLINNNKKELSIGYRCLYKLQMGVYNGVAYDVVQYAIRGNHLALVVEGRAGPDVAVLDHFKFTFDEKGVYMQTKTEVKDEVIEKKEEVKEEGSKVTLEEAVEMIMALKNSFEKFFTEKKEEVIAADADDKDDEKEKTKAEDGKILAAMDSQIKSLTGQLNDFKKSGMKTLLKEVSQRDKLARQLTPYVGTFDHAALSVDEVAQYGLKKLNITANAGQELAVLEGFLAGAKKSANEDIISFDSKLKNAQGKSDYLESVR